MLLITITGATGIGKTNLSLSLAKKFKTCIISCDSRQFYKEIPIGTAAPTKKEQEKIKHYFVHHKSVKDNYNVGDFEKDAIKLLQELFKKYAIIFMVGGSGLYMDSVINGLDDFPKIDASIRENLQKDVSEKGIVFLQEQLKILDAVSYETIDLKNPQRVLRALEVCLGTDKKFSDFKKHKKTQRNFQTLKIGLKAPREIMYERIENRIDKMLENGWIEEAKKMYPFKNYNALQTVGYKELFAFFDGKISLEKAVEEIKKNTRRFAKKQCTWFSKDPQIHWFDYQEKYENIQKFLEQKII